MTLHLTVGLLADLRRRDQAIADDLENEFEAINKVLKKHGHEPHVEPLDAPLFETKLDPRDLHCLRRLAANLDFGGVLPSPGSDDNVDDDELTERYYESAGNTKSFLSRVLSPEPPDARHFDHLIVHRDDDGFYLPIDLEQPIEFTSKVSGPGWIGSSLRLFSEVESLRLRLEEPDARDAAGNTPFVREMRCVEALAAACAQSHELGAVLAFT